MNISSVNTLRITVEFHRASCLATFCFYADDAPPYPSVKVEICYTQVRDLCCSWV